MRIKSTAITFLAMAGLAAAFDGSKQGFVLGGSLGIHRISIDETLDDYGTTYDWTGSKVGVATDFLIGYGFTPNFMLLYQNSDSWYTIDKYTYYDAIGPFGIRYYFQGDQPGPYLGAGAILGSFVNKTKDAGASGTGFTLTAGYEVAKHFSLEAKYLHLKATDDEFTHTSNAVQFLISGLAY
jgi:hypothetical protein